MTHCACGRELGAADRFCAQCGRAVIPAPGGTETGSVSSSDPDRSPLLDTVDRTSSVRSQSEVSSSVPVRWAVLGVAAVAVLMWGLYSWPQPEAETAVGGDRAADQAADGGDRSGEAEDEADEQDGEAGAGTDQTTTEAEPDDRTEANPPPDPDTGSAAEDAVGEAEEAGPLVGEATGLGLIIGHFDSGGPLEVINLDTGGQTELEKVRGRPVAMSGTTLIAARHGLIMAADLTSIDSEPVTLMESPFGWVDYIEVEGDTVWTIRDTEDSYDLIGLSLDGEVREEIDLLTSPIGFGWPTGAGGDEVVQSSAGGIYRRDGSDFERLSTGRILALGERLVLVDECDDRMRCRSAWYQSETWARLDLPVPDLNRNASVTIGGSDRWVIVADWRTSTTELIDVETGLVTRELGSDMFYGLSQTPPISADGRWLVDRVGSKAVIVDLDNGREWPLDLFMSGDGVVLFIELAGTAFTG